MTLPNPSQEGRSDGPTAQSGTAEITPELVKQIADAVYAALLRDLALERERAGGAKRPGVRSTGRQRLTGRRP